MQKKNYVITFGLTPERNTYVKASLPNQDYELLITDEPTDILAIGAVAVIIQANALTTLQREMLFDFYEQVDGCTDETTLWLGKPNVPANLRRVLKNYDTFDAVREKLKYILLTAHSRVRQSRAFSYSISLALRILSEIRKKPGVTSRQLADMCEVSPRTIQRYIETLRCSGEWIEYDFTLRGWKLFHNASILFGDV